MRYSRHDRIGDREVAAGVEGVGGDGDPNAAEQVAAGQHLVRGAGRAAAAAKDQIATRHFRAGDHDPGTARYANHAAAQLARVPA